MSNTVQPARYDLPWKAVITHAFHPFMDFYFPEFSSHIDWKQRPHFRDKELAGFGIGAPPDVMVADLLVELYLRDGRKRRVLLHIEIQVQRDAALARRMDEYNYRIGKACKQPVTSLVLLADTDPNWRPDSFRERVRAAQGYFRLLLPSCLIVLATLMHWRRRPIRLHGARWATGVLSRLMVIPRNATRPNCF